MEAYYLNKEGLFVSYKKGEKPTEGFWFLYYDYNGKILLTSSLYLHPNTCSIIMRHIAVDAKITPTIKPMAAGIFSTERRCFDDWYNIWINDYTSQIFRQPIINFFINEFGIL